MEQPVEGRTGQCKSDRLPSQLLLTAEQAAASLAICRTKLHELLRCGQLKSIQIGRSRRIPAADLEAYVQGLRQTSRSPVAAADCTTVHHRAEER
jgi:excisionase family DNA binding protein